MSRLVSVFGATGAQGGSVVRALLHDKSWKVVALTRDVNSDKAKDLKSAGAEVRACDFAQQASVEEALKGSYAVFGVTDFWASKSKENEIAQGINIVNASKKQGVQHLVFSTVENASEISGGKRQVHHFDSKAVIEEHIKKSGVPFTLVQPACYYENFKHMVRPNKDGHLEFTLPIPADDKFAIYSVADTGLVVSEVLNNKDKHLGKKIAMVGDNLSADEIAATLSKQFGKPVKFNHVPEKVFASFPMPGADELATMFMFFHEYGYYGEKVNKRNIWEGKQLVPLRSFAQWASDWKM